MSTETRVTDALGDINDVVPLRYEITSYGADYPVDSLVRRLREGDIFIPVFQRGFVWKYTQASKFIESLLIGLPVPGIFLSREFETHKMLVIDGHQRLKTLQYFYDGEFADSGKVFALRGVQPHLENLSYSSLTDEQRRILADSIIHATVVQQDIPPKDDSSIYYIFERINTGGTTLSSQEIRSCIYLGEFNQFLKDLNEDESWRSVYGRVNKRMKDEELILRFLALFTNGDKYKRPMREFLNKFMAEHRHMDVAPTSHFERIFVETISLINEFLGDKAFRPQKSLNAAVYDAVMVGVAKRLEEGPIEDRDEFVRRYNILINDTEFEGVTLRSTANEKSVTTRLEKAIETFHGIR